MMIVLNHNNHYETPDLGQAAYLILKDVPYLGVRWPTPQQAVFIFETPPDNILIAWLKEDGDKFRKFRQAMEALRNDILGAKR